ncbi:hypothetical protein CAPTEDRAFT_195673 [Capitella teleta]|uniref:Uncharacterized protein n=1 Tax=Capitella teleta TaxID=283909 RepID=X1ZVD2_CAPTE|nr:hypothetical protein CAPTEDRAFT_195673 [Capitella teleta]|eukprot:ELT88387.1 hypothetical protein CAPTEDRAFT_195673 [Capitella teleta]
MASQLTRYIEASDRTSKYLSQCVGTDGQLTPSECQKDVAFYYKLPTLLLVSGQYTLANRVLDYIHSNFDNSGDIRSNPDQKSTNMAVNEFYKYMDGWLYMAAVRLGRFEVAWPIKQQLEKYYPKLNTNELKSDNGISDIFMASFYGVTWMFNQSDLLTSTSDSNRAVELMQVIFDQQPNLNEEFFLRFSHKENKIITEFPSEMTPFYVLKRSEPNQLYFMLGFPIYFLAKMHEAGYTKHNVLDLAKSLLDFCLSCHDSIYTFHFAHKVALGASLVAKITKEEKYKTLALRVADNLVSLQADSGLFLPDADAMDRYDQSAEIGVWLREIASNLDSVV